MKSQLHYDTVKTVSYVGDYFGTPSYYFVSDSELRTWLSGIGGSVDACFVNKVSNDFWTSCDVTKIKVLPKHSLSNASKATQDNYLPHKWVNVSNLESIDVEGAPLQYTSGISRNDNYLLDDAIRRQVVCASADYGVVAAAICNGVSFAFPLAVKSSEGQLFNASPEKFTSHFWERVNRLMTKMYE